MKKITLNDTELKNILKMYNEELVGSFTISLRTGISRPTIIKILKENGVNIGPSGRRFIGGKKVANKKYRLKNKEKIDEYTKSWNEKNKEHRKKYLDEYRKFNLEKIRKVKRNYEKTRKSNDPLYKLIANFRTAIYQVLKENNLNKNGHYFEILKYTPEQLIEHLESLFTDGMSWENYGEWHVDHILPITHFNITEPGDEEFMKCWCLENLQPMWGEENIKKSNKVLMKKNN
jgi:hypothetical protein